MKLSNTKMNFFYASILNVINTYLESKIFWPCNCLLYLFVNSISVFCYNQTGKHNFGNGEIFLTFFEIFFTLFKGFISLKRFLVPTCTIKQSGLVETKLSVLSKFELLVPPGIFFIFTEWFLLNPFSYMLLKSIV